MQTGLRGRLWARGPGAAITAAQPRPRSKHKRANCQSGLQHHSWKNNPKRTCQVGEGELQSLAGAKNHQGLLLRFDATFREVRPEAGPLFRPGSGCRSLCTEGGGDKARAPARELEETGWGAAVAAQPLSPNSLHRQEQASSQGMGGGLLPFYP